MDVKPDDDVGRFLTITASVSNVISSGVIENIEAPKTIERLNQISIENAEKRKLDKDDDDEDETIEFGEDANIEIDDLDIDKIEL